MALARRLTSLGRAARSEAGVKVRQPLARALVFLPPDAPEILRDIVADELNVDEIDTADELSEVIEFELVPNFRTLGPRLGERVKELKPALAALDSRGRRGELEAGDSITVVLGGEPVELSPDDVQLRVRGQEGFAVSRESGEVVALDLDPRRRTAQAGPGPRGRAAGPGPAQDERPRGLRPHPAPPGGPRLHRRALRLHRPRGVGDRDPGRARRRARERCSNSRTSTARCRRGSGSRRTRPGTERTLSPSVLSRRLSRSGDAGPKGRRPRRHDSAARADEAELPVGVAV